MPHLLLSEWLRGFITLDLSIGWVALLLLLEFRSTEPRDEEATEATEPREEDGCDVAGRAIVRMPASAALAASLARPTSASLSTKKSQAFSGRLSLRPGNASSGGLRAEG